jgi:LmbE family N-acetylglucosaminyl deacetylase
MPLSVSAHGKLILVSRTDKNHPEKIIVIFAHPDDAEGNCGGTTAKWVREGRIIHYLVLTNGDKGSDDPAMTSAKLVGIREREQEAAAKVLGVSGVTFLRIPDGELEASLSLRQEVTSIIRLHQPNIVFAHDP